MKIKVEFVMCTNGATYTIIVGDVGVVKYGFWVNNKGYLACIEDQKVFIMPHMIEFIAVVE